MADQGYGSRLRDDLGSVIDALPSLSDQQKHFLRSRWMDQVVWMEGKAARARRWHYRLRLAAVVGGVVTPALVGLQLDDDGRRWVGLAAIVLGVLVAAAVGIEGLLQLGDTWHHYRRTVEALKGEGWLFFQLSGPYRSHATHADAYRVFAERVEGIIQPSIEGYLAEISKVRKKDDQQPAGDDAGAEEP